MREGGICLTELKCKTLLYNRIQILGATEGTVMAQLFHNWAIRTTLPNPPQVDRIPKQFEHLQQYTIDMAYNDINKLTVATLSKREYIRPYYNRP
jgi:hypothetical protein